LLAENFTALAGFARKYVKDLDAAKEIANFILVLEKTHRQREFARCFSY